MKKYRHSIMLPCPKWLKEKIGIHTEDNESDNDMLYLIMGRFNKIKEAYILKDVSAADTDNMVEIEIEFSCEGINKI